MGSRHETADFPAPIRAGWPEWIEGHMEMLRSYVRLQSGRELRSKEPVDDLVQSIARELLGDGAQPTQVADEDSFRKYMYAVAHNKIVSKKRYHEAGKRDAAREEQLSDELWELPEPEPSSALRSPSRCVERSEDLERLRAAFAALAPADRRILFMRRILDLPAAHIAQELGLAESTVRWRLSAIMAELATKLG